MFLSFNLLNSQPGQGCVDYDHYWSSLVIIGDNFEEEKIISNFDHDDYDDCDEDDD